MKVLFINPLTKYATKDIMPPLGLAWLAAVLEENDIPVQIIDALIEKKNLETLSKDVEKYGPDLIGITCVTHMRYDAFKTADMVKEALPDTTVVMGGPHVTFTAEDTLKNIRSVDIIVRGEGEITFPELIEVSETNGNLTGIKGISFRSGGKIIHNPNRPFIEDLDSLPFPARHLLPMEKYEFKIPFTDVRATNVLSSRGCPFGCTYCSTSTMWGKRIRMRSPSNIVDEIEQITKKYGIKGIYFFDDTFTFQKSRTISVCNEIIDRGLDVTWLCESRADVVDRELLTKMKEAGCKVITFGLESGSQRMLNNIKKSIRINQSINAINLCREVGIKSKAFFMYSLPGETPEELEATIRFAYDLNPDVFPFGMCEIRPGTEVEDIARRENIIPQGYSWAKEANVVPKFRQKNLPEEEIDKIFKNVKREYYLKPSYILKRLTHIKDIATLKEYVSAVKGVFF